MLYGNLSFYGFFCNFLYFCTPFLIGMKSDIEIARSTELMKIKQIAQNYGIPTDQVHHYGSYMAKVSEALIDEEKVKQSNLILVTAITPTKAGIGKTTVSIGLALGLNRIGRKAFCALRSLRSDRVSE